MRKGRENKGFSWHQWFKCPPERHCSQFYQPMIYVEHNTQKRERKGAIKAHLTIDGNRIALVYESFEKIISWMVKLDW